MTETSHYIDEIAQAEGTPPHVREAYDRLINSGACVETRNPEEHLCVMICLISPERSVYMALHTTFNLWFPPAGHVEEGETLLEAAIRECSEETGLDISADRMMGPCALTIHPIKIDITCRTHYEVWYYVRVSGEEISSIVQNDEALEARWASVEELKELETTDDAKDVLSSAIGL